MLLRLRQDWRPSPRGRGSRLITNSVVTSKSPSELQEAVEMHRVAAGQARREPSPEALPP